MRKSFSYAYSGLLFSVCLVPSLGFCHNESKGFYGTIYSQQSRIGSSQFTESGSLGKGSGLRADFQRGIGLGGDVGYRYGNGWASEFEWNYRTHGLNALRQGSTALAQDGDFASNIFFLNGLRRFKAAGALTPYVGAGIGWAQEIDMDIVPIAGNADRGYSGSSKTGFQLIGGVEYALSPRWHLTADARWLKLGSVRLDNEKANPGGVVSPLKYEPFSLQIGFRYKF
jgi:opacity protein-like surface antigen